MNESGRTAHIQKYLEEVAEQFNSGHAIEHAYRPALKQLMSSFDDTTAVNDPRHSEYGAPDFVFLKKSNNKIIRGYAEAKDITVSLDKTEKGEQMQRYHGYANLFLTDYLEFRFFRNGEKYETISLGKVKDSQLRLTPENGERLMRELEAFLDQTPEKIRSGKRLAQIMGGKARRIRDNVAVYLEEGGERNQELTRIYEMMKQMLVHDLEPKKFADMYAQTLVYGLFVARYDDDTPASFTRNEARDLVPKSNPFLRHFFDHIVGPDFDTRLAYIVDEMCEIFSVSDVADIVHKHLRIQDSVSDAKDPIIHFYEDFLQEYDSAERKKMGAYYTPVPVVKYIVRSVDRILKEEFGIAKGLASTDTVDYWIETGQDHRIDKRHKAETGYNVKLPRVQILDPAVGTATFLNETIKHIHRSFAGQEGRWESYVNDNLLKRLYGFELMMAPYTIAHLKLGMTLKETGVNKLSDRLGVYLTNTLEEGIPNQQDLFSFGLAEAVSQESKLAAQVKSERPVMVVMGNPPYSGVSSNETKYANSIIKKYKVEPGGTQKLQERKHWLNDDYVKFLAFAEDMISKNDGVGIVAMITNNGFLDNPTFRGMRWKLAETFDKIYITDLHGNSKKKEIAPDGTQDQNVFDIMQGVSIMVAVKTSNSKESAKIYHSEVYGKRSDKFASLDGDTPQFSEVKLDEKMYYFVPKNNEGREEYDRGIPLSELMPINTTGIVTMGDSFIVDENPDVIADRVQKLANGDYTEQELNSEFGLGKNYAKYALSNANDLDFDDEKIVPIAYRPFDKRYTYFDNKVVWRWREKVMRNLLPRGGDREREREREENLIVIFERSITDSIFIVNSIPEHAFLGTAGFAGQSAPLYVYDEKSNTSILSNRQQKTNEGFHHVFASDEIAESSVVSNRTGEITSQFPLYLTQVVDGKRANFSETKIKELFSDVEQPDGNSKKVYPEDLIDYIYASLHSPSYRQKYKEFLKTDFPRVPRPANWSEFWRLTELGRELRGLHLMKSSAIDQYGTTFSEGGDNEVEKVEYKDEKIWINSTQYFGNIPETAWSFWIGGYQPAQKWLKDRKGRNLSDADLDHYQKIIKVLTETARIMQRIG